MRVWFLSLLTVAVVTGLTVPVVIDSNMVLQRAPQKSRVWGWGTANEKVTIQLDQGTSWSTTAASSDGSWQIDLDPQEASTGHTLTISAPSGTKTLTGVAFGDVWLCSGQSNMQMSVNGAFNASTEIQDSANYPNLRYFTEQLIASDVPLTTMGTQANYNWGISGPSTMTAVGGGDFNWPSATCYFFGREIYKYYKGSVPIGLVVADWGGTRVEAWSSPDALAQCNASFSQTKMRADPNENLWNGKSQARVGADPNDASALWNGMIYPLLPMRFFGAAWYQGEANAGNPGGYTCTFPAMISDWRVKFNLPLPFFFVQLAGYPDGGGSYPYIRQAQLAALQLPNVGFATAIDLGDPTSPDGSIHPRRKQEVGRRLALSALALAYGQPVDYLGPTLTSLTITQPTSTAQTATATMKFSSANNLHSYGSGGCTTCCNESPIIFGFEDGSTARGSLQIDSTNGVITSSVAAKYNVLSVGFDFEDFPQCAVYNGQGGPDDHTGIAAPPFQQMSPPKSYQLVARQTYPYFYTKGQWSLNSQDPANNNYAILNTLDNFKRSDGTWEFKLRWPTQGNQNIWKQTSNPVTSSSVTGYQAINVSHTDNGWGGLQYNVYGESLLDGSVFVPGNWFYAIGSFGAWNNGIPGWNSAQKQVELYVQKNRNDGWTLVFRQTYPYFYTSNQWSLNPTDPGNDMYSILDQLESYRSSDGTFTFKLYWPEVDQNIWRQTNNPVTTAGVSGYQPVVVTHTEQGWGGLQNDTSADSLLDGSVTGTGLWYYAVGSTHDWNGGIPSWGPAMQQVELFARTDKGQL